MKCGENEVLNLNQQIRYIRCEISIHSREKSIALCLVTVTIYEGIITLFYSEYIIKYIIKKCIHTTPHTV